ncbi:MAG: beta-N-acetylhexosaminidase [Arenicellales bacterium]
MTIKMNDALGALMLDVEGQSLCENDVRRLSSPSVGGVILFARNFADREQVTVLIKEIRAIRHPELLIAVDQEGGRVQRFQNGFTRLPAMAVFGERYDAAKTTDDKIAVLKLARSTAQLMAEELIECGIDFSFAPVLDLGLNSETIIGNRAFHATPETLIKIASAYIQGMQAAGMQATGKHFPGHGHVLADSHLETPTDQRTLSDIEANDLKPFVALKDQLGAVMTAHIDFPEIDADLPTFSSFWLKQVLRKEIGFEGLIFSDDLTMHGACVGGNIVERTERALTAGCDMALICNEHKTMDEALADRDWRASEQSQQRFINMKAAPQTKLSHQLKEKLKQELYALC